MLSLLKTYKHHLKFYIVRAKRGAIPRSVRENKNVHWSSQTFTKSVKRTIITSDYIETAASVMFLSF